MLPEAGATELIFLAAIALIVVGPKDLPVLMRKVGQWVGKMRSLAAEFRSSFDELARQSELDELRKEVEALRNSQMANPLSGAQTTFDEINSGMTASGYAYDDPHPAEVVPHPEPAAPTTVEEIAPTKPVRKRSPRPVPASADADAAPKPAAKPRAPRKPKAVDTSAEPEG